MFALADGIFAAEWGAYPSADPLAMGFAYAQALVYASEYLTDAADECAA